MLNVLYTGSCYCLLFISMFLIMRYIQLFHFVSHDLVVFLSQGIVNCFFLFFSACFIFWAICIQKYQQTHGIIVDITIRSVFFVACSEQKSMCVREKERSSEYLFSRKKSVIKKRSFSDTKRCYLLAIDQFMDFLVLVRSSSLALAHFVICCCCCCSCHPIIHKHLLRQSHPIILMIYHWMISLTF